MSLSIPIIAEPLFECAKLVVVKGYVPGAQISIYAFSKDAPIDSAVLIGQGQSFSASGEVFGVDDNQMQAGTRLYATQTLQQDTGTQTSAIPADDMLFVTVQKVISLPTPHLSEPLYECSRCVRVEGILPGAAVDVTATKNDTQEKKLIGKTSSFGTGTDVSVSPSLQIDFSILGDQWICSEDNKSNPSQSIHVAAVSQADKFFLPHPTIKEPVFPCQQYVVVDNCRPGADIELFINNQPASAIPACATMETLAIWINQQLSEGDALTVRQSLCEGSIVSVQPTDLIPVNVVSSSLLPIPEIQNPLYEGDTSIDLTMTVSGEIVSIEASNKQIGMAGAGGLETTLHVESLKAKDKIIANVTLCDGSKTSRPVFVRPRPTDIPAPTVDAHLIACSRRVLIENCIPGANIRVFAQKNDNSENMLIGQSKTYAPSITVTCVAFLEPDWKVFATQTVGGKESKPSDNIPVREVMNLPQISVHRKIYTCAHCLLIEHATVGARIDVYQNHRWIGGTEAQTQEVVVDVYPALKKNLPIIINERLCDQKTAVTTRVDADIPMHTPRIVSALPNEKFVTVDNLIPGALVEVKEISSYNQVIGRACVAKAIASIPVNIALFVGAKLTVRQTLCNSSAYTKRVYRVDFPKEWPLRPGPFAVSSLEITDLPITSEFASNAANLANRFPFLNTGNIGVIHFPSTQPDSGAFANGGPFPLIAFAHAKNSVSFGDPSAPGLLDQDHHQLDAILKHLASWGFICISPEVFWISASGDGREFALRDAVTYMLQKNDTDSLFHNKIDRNKIGVMGHSSGGAGALNFTINRNNTIPLGNMVKATALIGPAVGRDHRTDSRFVTPRPLLILDGTEDTSISYGASGDPLPLFNAAIAPKVYVLTTGANHFNYTTSMSAYDDGDPARTLSREDQQAVGKAYITSFFRRYLQNVSEMEEYLLGRPMENLENFTIDVRPDIF